MLAPITNSQRSQMNYGPRVGQSAADGPLIVCECNLCWQPLFYLSTELVVVFHSRTFLDDLFGCATSVRSGMFAKGSSVTEMPAI
ncbi:MAG: hypothetical protein KKF33_13740 [Alphaproteobacteria bacterium]|nr:hypothetical protein [Alphaproteobacteria bacterium]